MNHKKDLLRGLWGFRDSKTLLEVLLARNSAEASIVAVARQLPALVQAPEDLRALRFFQGFKV